MKRVFFLVLQVSFFVAAQELDSSIDALANIKTQAIYRVDTDFPMTARIVEDGKECLYNEQFCGKECCAGCCFAIAAFVGCLEGFVWPAKKVIQGVVSVLEKNNKS